MASYGKERILMTLPNKITIFRIILVPFFVFFLLFPSIPNNYLISLAIFAFASFTDLIDGKIARKRNMVTDFGKFSDPLADKILVMSAFSCFVQLGIVNAVVLIIVILREFTVVSIRFMAISKGKVVAANYWGKVKTVSQMIAILFILFANFLNTTSVANVPNFTIISNNIGTILIIISTIFTIVSGCIYVIQNREFIGCN